MKKIYGTYRPERITTPYSPDGKVTMNGTYTCGFFLSNQFGDWTDAGLTKILDSIIPEDKYISEIVPGVKKLTRLVVCEYNEKYVDPVELSRSLTNVGARFDIDIFSDIESARNWVRDNTSLEEVSVGKFLISPAGEFMGVKNEAVYLTIE